MVRVLVFAGSARRESFNKKLAAAAAARVSEFGAEVTFVDLADYPMPLFDGDLEEHEGLPENAKRMRSLMLRHEALLIACPEYNGSVTPLLKNTIDWMSRSHDGVGGPEIYGGKVAGLLAASPGGLGGIRGLAHVRTLLGGIGVLVVPGDLSVPGAMKAFADDGSLVNEKLDRRLGTLVQTVCETTRALQENDA